MSLHPCGTNAAYQRHLRHGTQVCDPCQSASRVRSRTYRIQRRRKLGLPVRADYIVGPSSDQVLDILWLDGPSHGVEISGRTHKSRNAVNKTISRLRVRGLVRSEKAHNGSVLVRLTDEAKRLLQ